MGGNESLPMPGAHSAASGVSSMVSALLALKQHSGTLKYLNQEKVGAGR